MGNALVVGSERGVGLALCERLSARGETVWAACRESSPELDALGVRVIERVDVGVDDSVARLAQEVDVARWDLVISNAAVQLSSGGLEDADTAKMAQEFQVNALGAVRVVRAALPRLGRGSKIALVSTAGNAAVPTSVVAHGERYGYRMSKGALNVYGASLALDLCPRGIAVVLLHPGSVDTKLRRDAAAASAHPGRAERVGAAIGVPMTDLSPAESAAAMLEQVDALTLETTGRWIDRFGRSVAGEPEAPR